MHCVESGDFSSVTLISRRDDILVFTKKVVGENYYLTSGPDLSEMTFVVSACIFIDLSSLSNNLVIRYHEQLEKYSKKIIYFIPSSVEESLILNLQNCMINKIVFPCSEEKVTNLFLKVVQDNNFQNQEMQFEYKLSKTQESMFEEFIGTSKISKILKKKILICSQLDIPVLLLGETGTGKSTAAKIIHQLSSRKDKPYVQINISNFEETIVDSELFGSEKGAYTDARKRDGKFKKAEGGTLFIDEIANASLNVQSKLLTVLDDGCYFSLGSDISKKANVRLIFATNADLQTKIMQKEFRKDLYYRIKGYKIVFPALRERKSDIRALAYYFANKNGKKITERAIKKLEQYSWPGNVRQLQFCIDSACNFEKDEIDIQDIEFDV